MLKYAKGWLLVKRRLKLKAQIKLCLDGHGWNYNLWIPPNIPVAHGDMMWA